MKSRNEFEKILDFSEQADSQTIQDVKDGDLTRSLNQAKPADAIKDKMRSVISKIDMSFLKKMDSKESEKFFETLKDKNNVLTGHPIITINNGKFTLSDWAKEHFPKSTHKNLQTYLQTLCDLSFSAVFKKNGEYQDDFIEYMKTNFGEDILKKKQTEDENLEIYNQLLNAASQCMTDAYRTELAVQTRDASKDSYEELSRQNDFVGLITNSAILAFNPYLKNQIIQINANNYLQLTALSKDFNQAIQDQEKMVQIELDNLRKNITDETYKSILEKENELLITKLSPDKKVSDWTPTDVSSMYLFISKKFSDNQRLMDIFYDFVQFKKLDTNPDYQALSTTKKIETLSNALTVQALKKESLRYQSHLDEVIEKKLNSVIKSLESKNKYFISIYQKVQNEKELTNDQKSAFLSPSAQEKIEPIVKLISDFKEANSEKRLTLLRENKILKELVGNSFDSVLAKRNAVHQSIHNLYLPNDNNKGKIKQFQSDLMRVKDTFSQNHDEHDRKYLKAVGHILASAVTLGAYAGARAIYSQKKWGTAQFWKSPEQVLEMKANKLIERAESGKGYKK